MIGLRNLMTGWSKRPSAGPGEMRFRLGSGILAEPFRHTINREGQVVAVEPRVMQVLVYLAERPGRIVSKEELRINVWGTHVVDEAVHRAISLLRSALGDTTRQSSFIETVRRHGYRLIIAPTPVDSVRLPPLQSGSLKFGAAALGAAVLALLVSPALVRGPAEAPPLPVVAPETLAIASAEAPDASIAQRQPSSPKAAPAPPQTPVGTLSKTPAGAPRAPVAASEPGTTPAVASASPPASDTQRSEAPAPRFETPVPG